MFSFLKSLSLGSPASNPGYSIAAPEYDWDSRTFGRSYVVWFGEPGGDTDENRAQFVRWLRKHTVVKNATVEGINWDDSDRTGKPRPKRKKQHIKVTGKKG